jgi:hypothetical protein
VAKDPRHTIGVVAPCEQNNERSFGITLSLAFVALPIVFARSKAACPADLDLST